MQDSATDFDQAVRRIANAGKPATSLDSPKVKLLPQSPVMTWYRGQDTPPAVVERALIDKKVLATMEKCIESGGPYPIFLHGHQGRGKTYAAYYHANRTYPKAGYVRMKWYATPRDLQAAIITHRAEAIATFRDSACVVIDNFGAVTADMNDFMSEELVALFDRREGQPTIIVSNMSPAMVTQNLVAPLASRLLCGTVVEYKGQDRRINRSL